MKQAIVLEIEGHALRVSNPEKYLWPEITKLDYLQYLIEMSAYLLPHLKNRLLTTIRYPDGVLEEGFYQKNIPSYAPQWIATERSQETTYILVNDLPTLVWLGSHASLEFHLPFHVLSDPYPTVLAFDLDPPDTRHMDAVLEVALHTKRVLDSLGLASYAKTSGLTGLQILLPIQPKYTYAQTRRFHQFIATYLAEKYPHLITIERLIKNRGKKVYVDYLQHGEGKTLPASYSPRAEKTATVSAPVSWEEVAKGITNTDFTIHTIKKRVDRLGDLFAPVIAPTTQTLEQILPVINQN